MEDRILSANPVFEAYGNAMTVRNNNSSRFGKWLEVLFHPSTLHIIGCQTVQYLLEKSRVVQVSRGERNYSIFYQLLAGVDEGQLKETYSLSTRNVGDYHYLQCCDGEVGVQSVESDHDNFMMTMDAMFSLGFHANRTKNVLSVVAAILHLGNIHFRENDQGNSEIFVLEHEGKEDVSSTPSPLDRAAMCLVRNVNSFCHYLSF